MYLQPHCSKGVFGNVYLSAGQHNEVNIAVMGVVGTFRLGHFGARVDGSIKFNKFFDKMRLVRLLRPLRLLRLLRSLRLLRIPISLSM